MAIDGTLGAPSVGLPGSAHDGCMTTKQSHRADPCTTCGQLVTRVQIYNDAAGHGRGQLAADYPRHAGRAVAGDKVDDECNYPGNLLS